MYKKPEKLFLLLALVFGSVLVWYTPPFQVPDEANHFYRAYGLSEGKLIADIQGQEAGSELPTSLSDVTNRIGYPLHFHPSRKVNIELAQEFLAESLAPDNRKFTEYSNTALYSPIPYIPQVLGISLGKLFGLSPLGLLYIGRFFNLCCWIALVYCSIRVTPIFKWGFLSVAMMPMSLFLATSLSADAMTNGLSLLFLALCLYWALMEDDKQSPVLSNKDILALFGVSVCLLLTKFTYGLLICLAFLIPKAKFRHGKTMTLTALFLLSASVAMAWNNLAKASYVPIKEWVNLERQLGFILQNPLKYLEILVNTYLDYLPKISGEIIGLLGHGDTPLPGALIWLYAIGLVLLVLSEKSDSYALSKTAKIWIAAIILSTGVTISTFVYLSFNPIEYPLITSIQGRYFIPLLIPFLLLFYKTGIPVLRPIGINERKIPIVVCVLAVIGFCTTFMTLYYRFYAG